MAKREEKKPVTQFNKKDFFAGIWALSGRNAFPTQLREEYIETLQKNFEGSKELLKKKELLSDSVPEVYKKIIEYDKELNVFKKIRGTILSYVPKGNPFA